MTSAEVTAARLLVLDLIGSAGEIADNLTTIAQTLANPSPHARDQDAITIACAIDAAAGAADALASTSAQLAVSLDDRMRAPAKQRLAATEGAPS